jgi:hypothetical protein
MVIHHLEAFVQLFVQVFESSLLNNLAMIMVLADALW